MSGCAPIPAARTVGIQCCRHTRQPKHSLCLPPPPRVAYSALDASMSFFHNFHNALMEYRVGDLTFKVLELEHARFRSRKLVRLGWAHDGEWPAKLK